MSNGTNRTGMVRWALASVTALTLAVPMTSQAADKKAERTWKANCASCHGAEGKADTEKGAKMKMADISTAAWQKKFTDDQMKKAINAGVSETRDGVKKEMDPFKDKLNAEQVDAIVAYIRTLAK